MLQRILGWLCLGALVTSIVGIGVGPVGAAPLGQRPDASQAPAFGAQSDAATRGQSSEQGGQHGRDRIRHENEQPGTTRWQSAELQQAAERHRGQERPDPHPERTPGSRGETPSTDTSPGSAGPSGPDSGGTAAQGQTEVWSDTPIRGYADQASVNV